MFLMRSRFARRYFASLQPGRSDETVVPIDSYVERRPIEDGHAPAAGDEAAEAS